MVLLSSCVCMLAFTAASAGVGKEQPARRICRPGPQPYDMQAVNARYSVLVIGDSISNGQMVHMEEVLCPVLHKGEGCLTTLSHAPWSKDGAALDSKYAMDTHFRMNGAGAGPSWSKDGDLSNYDRYGDGCLNATMLTTVEQQPVHYDLITFNYGVHDIDYADSYHEEWVPVDLYLRNLREIKHTLLNTGSKVLFHTSTPIGFNVSANDRIKEWNEAAKRVMREEPSVHYNDLYEVITNVCGEPPFNAPNYPGAPNCSAGLYNNVHYEQEGWRLLAESSAAAVQALLAEDASKVVYPSPQFENDQRIKCRLHTTPWSDGVQTYCPTGSTCMDNAFGMSGSGCCVGYGENAVQCPDEVHCCPEGWTCSAKCHIGTCFCEPPTPVLA